MSTRKIIHIDMDAFFAAVEQEANHELKGKPVIVGGLPNSRGVVATCSYEARKFGIHSAMPSYKAYKLCPEAVFLRPNFSLYKKTSLHIQSIFRSYTDILEPLSLDEAFLDVTVNKHNEPSATLIAKSILKKIFSDTNLTASAGVSYNKFLAKIASDYHKPAGLTVITPKQAQDFIDELPIGKFFGIGKVTENKMNNLGIKYGRDLRKYTLDGLRKLFGNSAEYFHSICRGIDNRPVEPARARKSFGKETTYQQDLSGRYQIHNELNKLAGSLASDLNKSNIRGRTITLKIRYHDFNSITRSVTLKTPIKNNRDEIFKYAKVLLSRTDALGSKIRLLGITVSNFSDDEDTLYFQPVFPFYK